MHVQAAEPRQVKHGGPENLPEGGDDDGVGLELAELGHDLGKWHRRPNDPYGRWNAFCHTCNLIAVAAVEAPDYLSDPVYGHALTRRCEARR